MQHKQVMCIQPEEFWNPEKCEKDLTQQQTLTNLNPEISGHQQQNGHEHDKTRLFDR
jgi:hypothetical protein